MQLKTIVITGPESSGKTTLTKQLADHFDTPWLPEYARDYIEQLDRPYIETDLLQIAKGQLYRESELKKNNAPLLFFDTSLEVIKIWSEYKFGRSHPWISEKQQRQSHSLYLLCSPDIPWEFDPQRENPEDRDILFKLYRQELTKQKTNFVEISGLNDLRLKIAIRHVRSLIHPPKHAHHA